VIPPDCDPKALPETKSQPVQKKKKLLKKKSKHTLFFKVDPLSACDSLAHVGYVFFLAVLALLFTQP